MALDWLPIDTPTCRPVARRSAPLEVGPFTAVTIPVPDVLASEYFLAALPPSPRRARRVILSERFAPLFTGATEPLSWLTPYPVAHAQPRLRRARSVEPSPAEHILVGVRMAWLPRYSARPAPRVRAAAEPGMAAPIQPSVVAQGVQCVEWGPEALTVSTFVTEALPTSTLLADAVTVSTLIDEDLC